MLGVCLAHLIFGEPWIGVSTHDRSSVALMASEFLATFGLVAGSAAMPCGPFICAVKAETPIAFSLAKFVFARNCCVPSGLNNPAYAGNGVGPVVLVTALPCTNCSGYGCDATPS